MPPAEGSEAIGAEPPPLRSREVFQTWWPLAGSWILMALELPLVSAAIARLDDPKIHLAAYGGIVFPIAMIVEAPIIMLLAASTALCKDEASYLLLRRFMIWMGAGLTMLHLGIVLTPLYGIVVGGWIGAPEEIHAPGRIGLLLMTPWTWSIAYRRLQQGVLIRFGRSLYVGLGTLLRLGSNVAVLSIGLWIGTARGIVVGSLAVAAGVVAEAIFSAVAVRPILRDRVRRSPAVDPPLTLRRFLRFYIPLAMTPLLTLLIGPLGSAAMSRMPRTLDSLAAWPVIQGLTFVFRSIGIAYNEVVVALLDRPRATVALRRFAAFLSLGASAGLLAIAATPLAILYFDRLSALGPALASLARQAVWFAVPLPALGVLQSWHQGILVHGHRTRAITESVALFVVVSALVFVAGILDGRVAGIFVALCGLLIGFLFQIAWIARHSRRALAEASPR